MGETYPSGVEFLKNPKAWPFIASMVLQGLAWIIAVASSPNLKCNSGTATTDVDYGDINGGGFFVGMTILGSVMEAIFLFLYVFIGLETMTTISCRNPQNQDITMMLNWWSVELSFHTFHTLLLGLASILFAAGIKSEQDDVDDIPSGLGCDVDFSGFIVAVILVFPCALIALGFLLRKSFQDFGMIKCNAGSSSTTTAQRREPNEEEGC